MNQPVTIRHIGYWHNAQHPSYPDPHALVDEHWDPEERHEVATYLATGTTLGEYEGLAPCRLCTARIGAREFTDGTFLWPEGLSHYVSEHSVKLPDDVVSHVNDRLAALRAAPESLDWWLAVTAGSAQS